MRVLIIEDEKKVADFVKRGLKENNFSVDIAPDGEEGLFLAESENYDLIILDLMLPKISGIDILQKIRKEGKEVPVICLTAKGDLKDKMEGFNAGTDDYIVKPFMFTELLARIRAVLKRANRTPASTELKYGDLILDQRTRRAERRGREIILTAKEYSILELLMMNPDQVVTRTMIIESAWDYNFNLMSNIVEVHIKRLREKIDADEQEKLIHTVWGMGYILKRQAEP
ncbi:MAG TPA: response regulator transcription factor [Candidatus Omnitrophota bacterium]|jgi:DNA-binding response OmpR family regulator|nr:response regulator transcription factor [Candidatus Omnitrophota bacterium]HPN55297.1 response regulator transcription factor [Candidatus Omnitrophota bacterium]